MAAISVGNYRNLANYYTSAQKQIAGVASYYYSAAYEIVALADFDPELALLTPFYTAYLATTTIFLTPPASVIQAVAALQNHILTKARANDGTSLFADINDWIDAHSSNGSGATNVGRDGDVDTSFKVPTEFATISGLSGYTIDAANTTTNATCTTTSI